MEQVITLIISLSLIYIFYTGLEFIIGFNLIRDLKQQNKLPAHKLPSVSIVMSALNEEKDIKQALSSMLQQNYPDFEIIVLNDRSTDKTPEIIEILATQYSNLKIMHIETLPPNWLGKNHALNVGSALAKGEWLLFTDADVNMKPDALLKSLSYAVEKQLDHLTIYEHHIRHAFWLKVLMLGSYLTYSMHYKPWRIRFSWSKKTLGHGAFNLVRKSAYQQCGGHKAIAVECLDDMKLGALLKQNGFKQDTVNGKDYIEREWYTSMREMVIGFKKNAFAVYEFRYFPLVINTILAVLFFFLPFYASIYCTDLTRWLGLINIALTFAISVFIADQFRLHKSFACLYPLSILLILYAGWNSALSVFNNKGIDWRGTRYSLQELKSKKI